MRVAILDDYDHAFDGDPAIAQLRQRVPVDVFTEKVPPDRLRDYEILVGVRERTRFDAAFFAALPNLRLIAQTGNHAYHVDLDAATRAGVRVALASSDHAEGMASSTVELTFALMLAALRNLPIADRALRAGAWPALFGRTLAGKKLGILGLGRIGRAVARIARAFDAELLAWGPTLTDARAVESGATRLPLDALLDAADIVTVHLKLGDQSRGLLDEARLRRIGPRGLLVNTARGAIVDEAALARVLAEGALGAAALDVFTVEPLPAESPLRRLDNVVLTPHLGWTADRTYALFAESVARIIHRYLDGALERAPE